MYNEEHWQVKCFLETACNPNFRRNLFHHSLFNYYILGEDIQKPDNPPYFKGEFLPVIRRLHDSPLSIARISVKKIYRFLVEEVTMTGEGTAQLLRQLRIESASPSIP
jgi:hypothetical protein